MAFFKKSKAQSCLHAIRQGQSHQNFQKYVVIDSENEDQVINMRHYDSYQQINRILLTEDKRSVILKSKGSTVTNFLSNVSEPDICADSDIISAEKQVKSLQKECELLENMINDMIETQSRLTVLLRKRERAQSVNHKCYESKKNSEPVTCQVSFTNENSQENIEVIKSKNASVAVKDPLSIVTPLFSKNIEKSHKKSLQIVKTVEIKSLLKPKKGRQNEPSKKLQYKKKKSVSKMKQTNKNRNSICKIGSKQKAY